MKRIFVVMHQRKPNLVELTRQLLHSLHSSGLIACTEAWLKERMSSETDCQFCDDGAETCDGVLSVGGDGTFLRSNAIAIEHDIPLLGVNIGTVGFLAEMDWEQLSEACKRLANDDFSIAERMMLKAELNGKVWLALNDVVLSRGGYARLIGVNAEVSGENVGLYIGDGLIVSTPTGSTGYSLSAGGPIVCPEVECIMLTPICAHSLQHRPVVAAPTQRIVLSLDKEHMHTVQGSVDGQQAFNLTTEQCLVITRADRKSKFIQMNSRGFFSTIRIKLTEWSR